jgi:hypothetical protein
MTSLAVERIESQIDQLSLSEKLWLMERLARRIREDSIPSTPVQAADLVAMADDPAIQEELKQIQAEFPGSSIRRADDSRGGRSRLRA